MAGGTNSLLSPKGVNYEGLAFQITTHISFFPIHPIISLEFAAKYCF